MRKDTYKRYLKLITYTLILAFILFNIKYIASWLLNIIVILSPLWIGLALAFVLNVPMVQLEEKVFKEKSKKVRIISLIFAIWIIVLLFLLLFAFVIPDLIDSATYLLGQLPMLITNLNDLLINMFKNTELSEYLTNFTGSSEIMDFISNIFKNMITNFSSILSNLVTFIINLVTGIIIAVYFLLEKESILSKVNDLKNRLFETRVVKKIDEISTLANKSFHDFITYQCLECLILGTLMFIAFLIFRFPYALTIAFLTTITAIIPIFGATFACIIGAVLIGTSSIKQAIVFVIVFQVIQQLENNLIYPRVVGKNVGLPPVITIIALIIGGKVAGIFGMIVCIPLTAIIYTLVTTAIEKDNLPKIKVPKVK